MLERVAVLAGSAGGLVLLWGALVTVLAVQARRLGIGLRARDALRLGPDVVRLVGRLVRDRSVPRRTRILLALLGAYLLCPVDLVPDFLPVLGWADDAIVAALALRLAVRGAGRPALERSWPGTREGLAAVLALARLDEGAVPVPDRDGGPRSSR